MSTTHTPIVHFITHPGTARKQNEDKHLIDQELGLYIVCDGLTHPLGAQCAETTCKEIQYYVKKNKKVIEDHAHDSTSQKRQAVLDLLQAAIGHASEYVYEQTQRDATMRGLFSTVCAVIISKGYAFIGHLGDCRVYSFCDGLFKMLTRDHTFLTSMLAEGKSIKEAKKVSFCNNLSAAVGYQPFAKAAVQMLELTSNERLVLCSDGLSDCFEYGDFNAPDWADIASETLPQLLLGYALERKSPDNISAMVVQWDLRKADRETSVWEIQSKLGTIREIRLFQHLGDRSLMKLMSLGDARSLKAGEVLIQKGVPSNEMYVILSGELSLDFGKGPDASTLKRGEVLGEMSLFEGALPAATLIARQESVVLSFHRDQLFKAMRDDTAFSSRLMLGVLQAVIRRLRARTETDQGLKNLGNYSVVSILPVEKN